MLRFPFSPSLYLHSDMDSATDTDSDESHSGDASYPTRTVLSRTFGPEQIDRRSNLNDVTVHAALEALKTVDTRLLVEVTWHISLNENPYKLARIPHMPTLSGERPAP